MRTRPRPALHLAQLAGVALAAYLAAVVGILAGLAAGGWVT